MSLEGTERAGKAARAKDRHGRAARREHGRPVGLRVVDGTETKAFEISRA